MSTPRRPRLVTIMGSGETAPTMVKVHRSLIERLRAAGPVEAVVIDTPYGFQENASELATRAQDYFATSVGQTLTVAGLTRLVDADPLIVEQGLARLRTAHYVFAGPGSPTYALRQWAGSPLVDLLADKMRSGGAVTFASAAALTLGRFTVPVYEIYKAGEEPTWRQGLDLLSTIGLHVAVIPHYDNAEGGHHDTRFCYLGERRLARLETELDDDVHVLGIDEHTGVVLDLDADTATVVGNGRLTVRVKGRSIEYPSGATIPIDRLRQPDRGTGVVSEPVALESPVETESGDGGATSLGDDRRRLEADFDDALGRRDAAAAVRAVLELDAAILAWSADTLQSDETDRARSSLRTMIVRLGEAATSGLRDPAEVLGPLVDVALDIRRRAREEKRYDWSDIIRDGLAAAGVEVRDTRDGVDWEITAS
jgi:hypothetical protein